MLSRIKSPFFLKIFLLRQLPLAFFAGLKVNKLQENSCQVSIPFKWLTKNPFRSMYFAAQSMAAEFSTALLVVSEIEKSKSNVALLIVSMKAEFIERAVKKVVFTCQSNKDIKAAIAATIDSGEPQSIELVSKGLDSDGNHVSTFWFTWSVKLRS